MGLLGNIAEVIYVQIIATKRPQANVVSFAISRHTIHTMKHSVHINSYETNPATHLLNQVKACRRRLMSGPFVAEFSFLLDSGKDGIEVEA